MNEKKSNAPVVIIVVIAAVVLLGIPCLIGVVAVGGSALLFWKANPGVEMQLPQADEVMIRETDSAPAAKGEPEPPEPPAQPE